MIEDKLLVKKFLLVAQSVYVKFRTRCYIKDGLLSAPVPMDASELVNMQREFTPSSKLIVDKILEDAANSTHGQEPKLLDIEYTLNSITFIGFNGILTYKFDKKLGKAVHELYITGSSLTNNPFDSLQPLGDHPTRDLDIAGAVTKIYLGQSEQIKFSEYDDESPYHHTNLTQLVHPDIAANIGYLMSSKQYYNVTLSRGKVHEDGLTEILLTESTNNKLIGAVLIQDFKPVSYALTNAEGELVPVEYLTQLAPSKINQFVFGSYAFQNAPQRQFVTN